MKNAELEQLQEALNLRAKYGSVRAAAKVSGIARSTLNDRVNKALESGMVASGEIDDGDSDEVNTEHAIEIGVLNNKIKELQKALSNIEKTNIDIEEIRRKIGTISDLDPKKIKWFTESKKSFGPSTPGVPTLFFSDWHWGEVIKANQMVGIPNNYDLSIARERAFYATERAIDLLFKHMVNPDYPGLVLALGGDFFAGDIHEELTETNEQPLMLAFLDLLEVMSSVVEILKKKFKKIHIVCVAGNHGRTTKKVRHKDRAFTNFDWLFYNLLNREFKDEKDITFQIPDGPDAYYRIYNHKYLLTHGDQFRGGDGIIGPVGPVIRGDYKKRIRQSQLGYDYDTLLYGHFHTLIQMLMRIGNGSLPGYGEYGYSGNFSFEKPMQALWITHPMKGITFQMPVHCIPETEYEKNDWVSIKQ